MSNTINARRFLETMIKVRAMRDNVKVEVTFMDREEYENEMRHRR